MRADGPSSVAPAGPFRTASERSLTVTAEPVAVTATWNAQNSFWAHESAIELAAVGAGSFGRTFSVSRTTPAVIAPDAVPARVTERPRLATLESHLMGP